jgi:hypothetical protein
VKPLPVPCPADLIPDVTGIQAFNAAYQAAKHAGTTFVGVERRGRRWTVKTDRAAGHAVDAAAAAAVRETVRRLVIDREVQGWASMGPQLVHLNGIAHEHRARELAAALHAALYGHLEPLSRAVPTTVM